MPGENADPKQPRLPRRLVNAIIKAIWAIQPWVEVIRVIISFIQISRRLRCIRAPRIGPPAEFSALGSAVDSYRIRVIWDRRAHAGAEPESEVDGSRRGSRYSIADGDLEASDFGSLRVEHAATGRYQSRHDHTFKSRSLVVGLRESSVQRDECLLSWIEHDPKPATLLVEPAESHPSSADAPPPRGRPAHNDLSMPRHRSSETASAPSSAADAHSRTDRMHIGSSKAASKNPSAFRRDCQEESR